MSDEAERWRELNRANWDERTKVHLGPGSDDDLASLRSGHAKLHPIEDAELGDVRGLRALHLQCHFGVDTLKLAQRGASVVGLDFSPAAIEAARKLAAELGLAGSARFVLAEPYDAPTAIAEPALGPRSSPRSSSPAGGSTTPTPIPRPVSSTTMPSSPTAGQDTSRPIWDGSRWSLSTTGTTPIRRRASRTPPVSSGCTRYRISERPDAGLTLDWLHEHAQIPWRMFQMLIQKPDGDWHWPDKPWLPLSLSLQATRR